jgi:predicted transcriptional regulator
MTFEIIIKDTPVEKSNNIDDMLLDFLYMIGMISKYDKINKNKNTIPFKLFRDHFLVLPNKIWQVSDLAQSMHTSKPTIYRYINKLKEMDIIQEEIIETTQELKKGAKRKGYKIRFGNLYQAWGLVDARLKIILKNYEEITKYIQNIIDTSQTEKY